MPNTYRIQVLTKEFVKEIGAVYSDAQYFTVDSTMSMEDFIASKEADINAEKDRRIANWIDAIKNPPPPVEPTKEQLQEEKAALQAQIAELDVKIAQKGSK